MQSNANAQQHYSHTTHHSLLLLLLIPHRSNSLQNANAQQLSPPVETTRKKSVERGPGALTALSIPPAFSLTAVVCVAYCAFFFFLFRLLVLSRR